MMEKYKNLLFPILLFSLIWLVMTEFSISSLTVGLPVIILASISFEYFHLKGKITVNFKEVPGFTWWFLSSSLKGGLDVSRRAFRKDMQLHPGFFQHRFQMPPGPARILVVNCIGLMPGTLSTEMVDDDLVIHSLDTTLDLTAEIREAETRVQRLLRLTSMDNV